MAEGPAAAALLPHRLGLHPFRPRLPWLNGDLQTLRDSLRPVTLPPETGVALEIPVPPPPGAAAQADITESATDRLLAFLDPPLAADGQPLRSCDGPLGLVLLMHGLGGSSRRAGLRRMGDTLQRAGFAVLRLNMRGAGPGRALARGTYSARCDSDLLPALALARTLADGLAPGGRPLLGMGISLGGTKLLNALLAPADPEAASPARPPTRRPLLDGLVCISSPLDLVACSQQIERPRNRFYQRWLLWRLCVQTAADPFGLPANEREALDGRSALGPLGSIRAFDAAITAPRWGYGSVDAYYEAASPLPRLLAAGGSSSGLPPALIVHAADDPWVPVAAAERLAASDLAAGRGGPWQVLITPGGGHNGFHASCDVPGGLGGCWGDRLTARWLRQLVGA
jgi:predicted alpha/beta-fold hydrolase